MTFKKYGVKKPFDDEQIKTLAEKNVQVNGQWSQLNEASNVLASQKTFVVTLEKELNEFQKSDVAKNMPDEMKKRYLDMFSKKQASRLNTARKNISDREAIVKKNETPIKNAKAQINDAYTRHSNPPRPLATAGDMKLDGQVKASDDFKSDSAKLEQKRKGYQTLMKAFMAAFPGKEMKQAKQFKKSLRVMPKSW